MPERPISFSDHLDPPDRADLLAKTQRDAKRANEAALRAARERERRTMIAIEDAAKRAWIEAGNETRQPPEYRGRVWEVADHDGVHPTAFPPLRDGAGGELTDEFIAFQAYNQVTYAKNPEYYCVVCKIRFNAAEGGVCGPCLGKRTQEPGATRRSGRGSPESGVEYPV